MNLADTLRGLLRRWYIVVPGILVAIAVSIAAWQVIKPDYERTSTQLLLPGSTSIPEAGNPYLYLGGLSQAADVLVTAMSSENVLKPVLEGHPGAQIEVTRDPATSGPMILTTVTARSDAQAEEMLNAMVEQTESELSRLQDVDGITAGNRIGIKTITIDQQSTLQQKTRILGVAGAALLVLILTIVLASLVDGLSTRRRRRRTSPQADGTEPELLDDEETADAEHDDDLDPHAEDALFGEAPERSTPDDDGEPGERTEPEAALPDTADEAPESDVDPAEPDADAADPADPTDAESFELIPGPRSRSGAPSRRLR